MHVFPPIMTGGNIINVFSSSFFLQWVSCDDTALFLPHIYIIACIQYFTSSLTFNAVTWPAVHACHQQEARYRRSQTVSHVALKTLLNWHNVDFIVHICMSNTSRHLNTLLTRLSVYIGDVVCALPMHCDALLCIVYTVCLNVLMPNTTMLACTSISHPF